MLPFIARPRAAMAAPPFAIISHAKQAEAPRRRGRHSLAALSRPHVFVYLGRGYSTPTHFHQRADHVAHHGAQERIRLHAHQNHLPHPPDGARLNAAHGARRLRASVGPCREVVRSYKTSRGGTHRRHIEGIGHVPCVPRKQRRRRLSVQQQIDVRPCRRTKAGMKALFRLLGLHRAHIARHRAVQRGGQTLRRYTSLRVEADYLPQRVHSGIGSPRSSHS